MMPNRVLTSLNKILQEKQLSDVQELVFMQVWDGKTYAEIADQSGYEHSYIRDVGSKLWQLLSQHLNQKVSKSNLRAVLRRYSAGDCLDPVGSDASFIQSRSPAGDRPASSAATPSPLFAALPEPEFPSGPVPLGSKFYVERPPIETEACAEIFKPGSLLRIKASKRMGKTSLMHRLLAAAR